MNTQTLQSWTRYHAAKHGLSAVDGKIAAALAMQPGGTDREIWQAAESAIRELTEIRQYELAHPESGVLA